MGESFSVEQFVGKIERVAPALEKARATAMVSLGKTMSATGQGPINAHLGGKNYFKHWRRGAPIPIVIRSTVTPSMVTVAPAGRGKGPARVLNDGRKGPMQGPALKGFTKRGKQRKVRQGGHRNNGTTDGTGAWDEGTVLMARQAPEKLRTDSVRSVMEVFR